MPTIKKKISQTLSVATYNIEISRKSDLIVKNIYTMAQEGVNVFCLQEVLRFSGKDFIIDLILKKLGPEWKAEFFIGKSDDPLGFGVAIIWNKKVLTLIDSEKFTLTNLPKLLPHEIIFTKMIKFPSTPILRRTLIATFMIGDKKIRICAVHLNALGGAEHRRIQATGMLNHLQKQPEADYEVICGDFNTIDVFGLGKEKMLMQRLFNQYSFEDMTDSIPWSQDAYYANFIHDEILMKKIILKINFHMPKKLDYIWGKNVLAINAERKDLMGSDHFPVVTKLDLLPLST